MIYRCKLWAKGVFVVAQNNKDSFEEYPVFIKYKRSKKQKARYFLYLYTRLYNYDL